MSGTSRYPEIDLLRGIAIVMMIIFHSLFDLAFFRLMPIDISDGFWRYFAYATASLFLLVVGISLAISHARAVSHLHGRALTVKFLVRGAGIFCCGLLVTVATWWYLQEGFVIFGILHLIGVAVMLSPLFFRFRTWNAVIRYRLYRSGMDPCNHPRPGGTSGFWHPPAHILERRLYTGFPVDGTRADRNGSRGICLSRGRAAVGSARTSRTVDRTGHLPWPALARDLPGAPAGDHSGAVPCDGRTGPLSQTGIAGHREL